MKNQCVGLEALDRMASNARSLIGDGTDILVDGVDSLDVAGHGFDAGLFAAHFAVE